MEKNRTLEAAAPVNAQAGSGTNPPYRILVVDDDDAIRLMNTTVLINFGYQVDVAADGADAWQVLNTDTDGYDLLITDNSMPKVTGVELLKKLRAARMDMPVIMATGTFPKEEFTRYPWLMPDATLIKPYTIAQLLGTVKEVLRTVEDANEPMAPRQMSGSQPAIGL